MLVENSVGDAVLYNAGREFMTTSLLTLADLNSKLERRREEKFPNPNYYLFDVVSNPAEDVSGGKFLWVVLLNVVDLLCQN